jgi:chorismate mutase
MIVLSGMAILRGLGTWSSQEGRPLQPIVEAVALRLTTADTVAASKWRSNAPIDDPAREEQVLASVAAQVRPMIDRQNTRILDQMREQQAVLTGTGCLPALLDAAGAVGQTLGPLHQATLARALVSLCDPVAP